jgi:hypothetical protein
MPLWVTPPDIITQVILSAVVCGFTKSPIGQAVGDARSQIGTKGRFEDDEDDDLAEEEADK